MHPSLMDSNTSSQERINNISGSSFFTPIYIDCKSTTISNSSSSFFIYPYLLDDIIHLYKKVDRDAIKISKTKKVDNIAPPNIIFSILSPLLDT